MYTKLCLVLLVASLQTTFTSEELAHYRLSVPVFKQFRQASRLIANAMRDDPTLAADPIFTREVSVLGDAPEMATKLEARLNTEPALATALFAADISAREYTKFALALFAARLAHGFVKSGVLRAVPSGVAAENVAFVEAHQEEIGQVLQMMGLEGSPPFDSMLWDELQDDRHHITTVADRSHDEFAHSPTCPEPGRASTRLS